MVSFILIPKKGNALISHASKVMLKILQARLQQYVNRELPDVQAGFSKGRGTRDQIANICWIIEKESSRNPSISALLIMPKHWTVWNTTNCGKFWKRWAYQTTWPASWEVCMQVRKQHLELDMEQQTGSKLGKEYLKVVYCLFLGTTTNYQCLIMITVNHPSLLVSSYVLLLILPVLLLCSANQLTLFVITFMN